MTEARCFRHVFFVTDLEGAAGVTDWSQTRKKGPRLGFLLASLDRDFVIERIKKAIKK